MFDKTGIIRLEGWLTVSEAANILGKKRSRIHQMVEEGKFLLEDLRFVGEKNVLLIREEAFLAIQNQQIINEIRLGK
jgi:hypothetical protein